MPGPEEKKQDPQDPEKENDHLAEPERFEELSRQARERDDAELQAWKTRLSDSERHFQALQREYRARTAQLEADLGMRFEDIAMMHDLAVKYRLGEYDRLANLQNGDHPYAHIAEMLRKSSAPEDEKKRLFYEEAEKIIRKREPWMAGRPLADLVKCIDVDLPEQPVFPATVGKKTLYALREEQNDRAFTLGQEALELRRVMLRRKEASDDDGDEIPEKEKTPAEQKLDEFWRLFNDVDYETVRKSGDRTDAMLRALSPGEDGSLAPADRLLDLYTDYLIEAHCAQEDPSRIVPTKEEAFILDHLRGFTSALTRVADLQDTLGSGGLTLPPPEAEAENGKKIHRVNAAGKQPHQAAGTAKDEDAVFVPVRTPLFGRGPGADDVKQGGLGDCYFLAALSAIAAQDPTVILNAMKDNKDGTVTVRFYTDDLEPVYVTVDKSIPKKNGDDLYARGDKESAWVKIMEKAYVQSGLKSGDLKKAEAGNYPGSYGSIEGGSVFDAVSMLLGQKQGHVTGAYKYLSLTSKSGTGEYSEKERKYAADLKEALRGGHIVTAGNLFRSVLTGTSVGKEREKIGGMSLSDADIATFHAYSVTGIEEENGKTFVIVRNPHAKRGVNSSDTGERFVVGKETAQGYSRLELRDFSSYFPYVAVSRLDVSLPCRERMAESAALVRHYGDAVRRISESLNSSDSPFLHFKNSGQFRRFRDSAAALHALMQSKGADANKLTAGLDGFFHAAKAYEVYCENDKKLNVFKDSRRAFVRYQAAKIADELKAVYDRNKDRPLKDKWEEFSYSAAETKADVPVTSEGLARSFRAMSDGMAEKLAARTGEFRSAGTREKLYAYLENFANEYDAGRLGAGSRLPDENQRYDFLQQNARLFCTEALIRRHAGELRRSMEADGHRPANDKLDRLLSQPDDGNAIALK